MPACFPTTATRFGPRLTTAENDSTKFRTHEKNPAIPAPAARGDAQRSYRIEVASDSLRLLAGDADLWDSGWVRSKRSVGVAYEGLPLTARTQCWWRVTARTEKGNRKAVSPVARFGIG